MWSVVVCGVVWYLVKVHVYVFAQGLQGAGTRATSTASKASKRESITRQCARGGTTCNHDGRMTTDRPGSRPQTRRNLYYKKKFVTAL